MATKRRSKILSFAVAGIMALGISAGVDSAVSKTTFDSVPTVEAGDTTTHTYRNVMYYGDWCMWGGQGFNHAAALPAQYITHLNYSFLYPDANGVIHSVAPATGEAPGETYNVPNGVEGDWAGWKGREGQIVGVQHLRAMNPNLKIGTSFGGWSMCGSFGTLAANDNAIANYAKQLVAWTRYNDFDFVDFDWEYPGCYREPDKCDNKNDQGTPDSGRDANGNLPDPNNPDPNFVSRDKANFVKMLRVIRDAFDKAGEEDGKYYEMSAAVPAAKAKIDAGLDIPAIYDILDFVNIMTYDLRGAWDGDAGHHAGLYPNPEERKILDPKTGLPVYAGLSTSEAVDYYISKGAIPEKTVVGTAFYSRGWENVDGGVDGHGLFGKAAKNYLDADNTATYGADNFLNVNDGDGGRRGGSWPYGTFEEGSVIGSSDSNTKLNTINRTLKGTYPGLVEYWDDVAKAPYMSNGKAFFTYDNPRSIGEKGKFVKEYKVNGVNRPLGGLISWMASNDRNPDPNGKWDYIDGSRDAKGKNGTVRSVLTKACHDALFGEGYRLPARRIAATPKSASGLVVTQSRDGAEQVLKIQYGTGSKETNSGIMLQAAEKNNYGYPYQRVVIKGNFKYSAKSSTQTPAGAATVSYDAAKDMTTLTWGLNFQGGYINGQNIGESMSISLECAKPNCKHRNHNSGNEIEYATISKAAKAGGPPTVTHTLVEPNWATVEPEFQGLEPLKVEFRSGFDNNVQGIKGVKAIDPQDGKELTFTVTGTVNTGVAGDYTLTYSATTKAGKTGTKTRKVTVKGEKGKQKPTFEGVTDLSMGIGDVFNPKAGITAKDEDNNDLTSAIEVTSNPVKVDAAGKTTKAGTYTVKFKVTDRNGNFETAERKVTVASYPVWDPNTKYKQYDRVVYGGKIYENTYWENIGLNPAEDEKLQWDHHWKVIGKEDTDPTPEFSGVEDKSIDIFGTFDPMEGVSAKIGDTNLTEEIEVDGEVNPDKLGEYKLTYRVTYNDATERKERTITVVAVKPVLSGVARTRTMKEGSTFDLYAGVKVSSNGVELKADEYDFTINIAGADKLNFNVAGEYKLDYTAVFGGLTSDSKTLMVYVTSTGKSLWNSSKLYMKNEIVEYDGNQYKCLVSNRNTVPATSPAKWRKITETITAPPYVEGKDYERGDLVSFDGKIYQATRTTSSAPNTLKGWKVVEPIQNKNR